jgi:hypothetical protein
MTQPQKGEGTKNPLLFKEGIQGRLNKESIDGNDSLMMRMKKMEKITRLCELTGV